MSEIKTKAEANEAIKKANGLCINLENWFDTQGEDIASAACCYMRKVGESLFSANDRIQEEPNHPPFRGNVPVCEAWLRRYMKVTASSAKAAVFFHLAGQSVADNHCGVFVMRPAVAPPVLARDSKVIDHNPTRNRIIELGTALRYEFKNVEDER